MKIFFDTNLLIAAFATRGLCPDLFAHVMLEHDLIVSEVVLAELRTKLRTKLKLPKKTSGSSHRQWLVALMYLSPEMQRC